MTEEEAYKLYSLIKQRQQLERQQAEPKHKKYPTDNSFIDIHGNELLHYVSSLGYLKKVMGCLKGLQNKEQSINCLNAAGKTPIMLALENGHNDIAALLYKEGASLEEVRYADCSAKKWFRKIIEEALSQYSSPSRSSLNFFPSNSLFKLSELLKRAAETGNIKFLKKHLKINQSSAEKYKLMICAAENGNLATMQFLHEKKNTPFDPPVPYAKSALIAAIRYQQYAVIDYLLQQPININYQNSWKYNALFQAIALEDETAVNKILTKKVKVVSTGIDGENILHVAALLDVDFVEKLISFSTIRSVKKELLVKKNIYGHTPIDIAIFHKKDDILQLFDPNLDLIKIRAQETYGQQLVAIDLCELDRVFIYYLQSQYQDSSYLNRGGLCSGINFLKIFYTAQKKKDYFFSTLKLLVSWDGTEESLKKTLKDTPQGAYYNNLGELFEQWINDIIWFQHSTLEDIDSFKQHDRFLQYSVIKNESGINYFSVYKEKKEFLRTASQIKEMCDYLLRMPESLTQIEVGGEGHVISVCREENFFDFFDGNFTYSSRPFSSVKEVVENIINYKYIFLETDSHNQWDCRFRIHLFFNNALEEELEHFMLFKQEEFPTTASEAAVFQKRSPNGFTHLHLAVITYSLPALERLLEEGFCDREERDIFGRTALEIAEENKFDAAVELLSTKLNNSYTYNLSGCSIL